jgi:hypothetical protein
MSRIWSCKDGSQSPRSSIYIPSQYASPHSKGVTRESLTVSYISPDPRKGVRGKLHEARSSVSASFRLSFWVSLYQPQKFLPRTANKPRGIRPFCRSCLRGGSGEAQGGGQGPRGSWRQGFNATPLTSIVDTALMWLWYDIVLHHPIWLPPFLKNLGKFICE